MLKEYNLAVEDYGRVIQLRKNAASAHLRRGVALFALGRLPQAIQDFDEAIEISNRSAKHLVESEGKLDGAAKLDPRIALAHNNRGSAYYQLGQTERAIEGYDRVIYLGPRIAEFYANRAFAFELLNRYDEAHGIINGLFS